MDAFSDDAGDGVVLAAAALAAAISRNACSEYGSFSAFGADFTLSPGRTAAATEGEDGDGAGFASAATGGGP
ncbi:MAG TPA: hypothetical protein VGN65_09100, partial [Casimicrobiaceae bacterium]